MKWRGPNPLQIVNKTIKVGVPKAHIQSQKVQWGMPSWYEGFAWLAFYVLNEIWKVDVKSCWWHSSTMDNHKYASITKIQHHCSTIIDNVNFKKNHTLSCCLVASIWANYIFIPGTNFALSLQTCLYSSNWCAHFLTWVLVLIPYNCCIFPTTQNQHPHIFLRLGMLVAFSNSTWEPTLCSIHMGPHSSLFPQNWSRP